MYTRKQTPVLLLNRGSLIYTVAGGAPIRLNNIFQKIYPMEARRTKSLNNAPYTVLTSLNSIHISGIGSASN